jgi:hypothetical protein
VIESDGFRQRIRVDEPLIHYEMTPLLLSPRKQGEKLHLALVMSSPRRGGLGWGEKRYYNP